MRGLFFLRRNMKQKKRKYGVELLVTSVSALLIFCVTTVLYSDFCSSLRKSKAEGDWHLAVYGQVQALQGMSKEKYSIERVTPFHMHEGKLLCPNYELDTTIVWYENPGDTEQTIVINGEYPDSAEEVLLPTKNRFLLGRTVDVGDTVTLREGGEENTYTVTGFYELLYEDETLNAGYRLISKADESIPLTDAFVEFDGEGNIKKKSERLLYVLECEEFVFNEGRLQLMLQGEKSGGTRIAYMVGAVVFLWLLYQMLRGTFFIHKGEFRKECAILRSVGAKPSALYRFALTEGLCIAVTSVIAGSLLGYGIMQITLRLSCVDMSGDGAWRYEGGLLGGIFAAAVLVPMLVVLKASQVRDALRLSVKDGLAEQNNSIVKRRKKKSYKNPVRAYLMTGMARNKRRVLLCGVSFFVSVFLYVLVSIMVEDLRYVSGYDNVKEPYYDVRVLLQTGYSEKYTTEQLLEEIRGLDCVEEAVPARMRFMSLGNVDQSLKPNGVGTGYTIKDNAFERLCISVYNEKEFELLQSLLKEPCNYETFRDGGCVLVNYVYEEFPDGSVDYSEMRRYTEKQVGDTVSVINFGAVTAYMDELLVKGEYSKEKRSEYVEVLKTEQNFYELSIAATAVSDLYYMSVSCPTLVMSSEYYNELVQHDNLEEMEFKVRLREGFGIDEVTEYCYGNSAYSLVDYYDYTRVFVEMMENAFGIMRSVVVIAVVVGIINAVCIVLIDLEVRRKEFAILRSVGATKRRLSGLVLTEKLLLCMGAGLLGWACAVPLERVLLLLSFSATAVSFRFPLMELLLSEGVLLVVVIGVSIFQMALLKSKNIAECMK